MSDLAVAENLLYFSSTHEGWFALPSHLAPQDSLDLVKHGLGVESLRALRYAFHVGNIELAELLQVSPRTLTRMQSDGRLDSRVSDRALRLLSIYLRVRLLYAGDDSSASRWLRSEKPALQNLTPLALMTTEMGAGLVEALVGRLEQGIVS
ncbi:MAG: antitoxin Xre/MbcA/ParS toxin-binding domain-containing protein [Spirochaetales bacterium]